MKYVQVTIDEQTLTAVDRARKTIGLKRSEVVREALRDWLRRRRVDSFEHEWITALRKRLDEADRAGDWTGVQVWGKR